MNKTKGKLLTIAFSGIPFHYAFYVAAGALYDTVFGPFDAYPPFEMAIYVGPLFSLGFCLCVLLGAVFSLEGLEPVGYRPLVLGVAAMAMASTAFLWAWDELTQYLDQSEYLYLFDWPWISDIGIVLAPWAFVLGICAWGFRLMTRQFRPSLRKR